MKKEKPKSLKLLAIFYFLLIFSIVVYLFMTLFSTPNGSIVDSEMMIFQNSASFNDDKHKIIMDFPKFAVKKY